MHKEVNRPETPPAKKGWDADEEDGSESESIRKMDPQNEDEVEKNLWRLVSLPTKNKGLTAEIQRLIESQGAKNESHGRTSSHNR